MIKDATFLGLSLHTRTRRRGLVIAYYTVLLLMTAFMLWMGHITVTLIAFTFIFGSFFGGITTTGPVKSYHAGPNPPTLPVLDGSGIQQLNLASRRGFNPFAWPSLDEREVRERDRAHYIAYRTLRWSIFPITMGALLTYDYAPAALAHNAPALLWMLVLYILSLPQSVILWTEPPPTPDASTLDPLAFPSHP